jgi:transposase InsO family protein
MRKHLSPSTRKCLVEAVRRTENKSLVAMVFGVCRKTVQVWWKRAYHRGPEFYRDRRPDPKPRKVTDLVEKTILAVRVVFEWGTARIQQALVSLPSFAREALEKIIGSSLPCVDLSRTAINDVLKRHKLNGYRVTQDNWKFFRAKRADELWQLDLKGPFTVGGKKFWIAVCVDDYSRYLILCELFDHQPSTQELLCLLDGHSSKTGRKPEKILTDRGGQFQESWKEGCIARQIEPLLAHPYYPQDKGKVERTIRNVAEEFVKLLKKFPEWLGRIGEYLPWYNEKRLHRGIKDYPAKLYLRSV